MAYQRKTGVPRTTTKHVDGYREKKLAQREIAGRAYALKTLKDAMYPIVKHNRYMELKRKGLMENLPDYFPTEEKLEQAYDAGDISLDNYYVFRGILREMNGVAERLPSREDALWKRAENFKKSRVCRVACGSKFFRYSKLLLRAFLNGFTLCCFFVQTI